MCTFGSFDIRKCVCSASTSSSSGQLLVFPWNVLVHQGTRDETMFDMAQSSLLCEGISIPRMANYYRLGWRGGRGNYALKCEFVLGKWEIPLLSKVDVCAVRRNGLRSLRSVVGHTFWSGENSSGKWFSYHGWWTKAGELNGCDAVLSIKCVCHKWNFFPWTEPYCY